jgi:protein-tyrosine phosphatase
VYVHCFGGIGRTGTVVGCYLVRHGADAETALAEIARRRQGTPDGYRRSPETNEQRQFVLTWRDTA